MPVDSRYCQAEQVGSGAGAEPRAPEPENGPERLRRVVAAMRNEQGQWQNGASGNPAGRPRGVRNRATLLAEALLGAPAATIANKTIESGFRRRGQPALSARPHPRAAPWLHGFRLNVQATGGQVEGSRLRGTAAECCKSVAAFPLHLQRGIQKCVLRRRPNPASGRRQTAAHLAEICGSA